MHRRISSTSLQGGLQQTRQLRAARIGVASFFLQQAGTLRCQLGLSLKTEYMMRHMLVGDGCVEGTLFSCKSGRSMAVWRYRALVCICARFYLFSFPFVLAFNGKTRTIRPEQLVDTGSPRTNRNECPVYIYIYMCNVGVDARSPLAELCPKHKRQQGQTP